MGNFGRAHPVPVSALFSLMSLSCLLYSYLLPFLIFSLSLVNHFSPPFFHFSYFFFLFINLFTCLFFAYVIHCSYDVFLHFIFFLIFSLLFDLFVYPFFLFSSQTILLILTFSLLSLFLILSFKPLPFLLYLSLLLNSPVPPLFYFPFRSFTALRCFLQLIVPLPFITSCLSPPSPPPSVLSSSYSSLFIHLHTTGRLAMSKAPSPTVSLRLMLFLPSVFMYLY